MRRFIALAAVLGICATIALARPLAHAAPQTSYPVTVSFTCWTVQHYVMPFPHDIYYAHFGYTATSAVTVPASNDYTSPAESLNPPYSFVVGTYPQAYVPSFSPSAPPTWHVGTSAATANTLSGDLCPN